MRLFFATLLLAFSMSLNAGPLNDANEAYKRGDFIAELELLKPLVESGNPDALGGIGGLYAEGKGVDKDLTIAHSYWSRAAEKHHGKSMFMIGTLYTKGEGGFSKDKSQAAIWYKKAAEHRHEQGMIYLSSIYANGEGLEMNGHLAAAWAFLAYKITQSEQSKKIYQKQLSTIASGMSHEDLDDVQKIAMELAKLIDANVEEYRKYQVPISAYK